MEDRRLSRAENARYVLVAIALSISFFFLMHVRDRSSWSWRLALFGATVGPAAYPIAISLRLMVRRLVSNRRLRRVLVTPLDFFSGCAAFVLLDKLLALFGLTPPGWDGHERRLLMLVVGLMTAEMGILFYVFHLTSKRLIRSVQRIKDQELAERELELARSLQQRLLPPEHIAGNGFDVRARNLAAQYVAGDFYDVFRLADGMLGVAVADVSGKGIGASLIMATVKAMLPLVAEGRGPAETLTELNRKLHHELPRHAFVALAYARFDLAAGTLELSNAGLPDQYLLRAGAAAEVLSVSGPRLPLGAWPEVIYQSVAVPLVPGDALLFLTDGLAEATTLSGEQLGYEKLRQLVDDASSGPDVLQSLFDVVARVTIDKLEDDSTALLLRARSVTLTASGRFPQDPQLHRAEGR